MNVNIIGFFLSFVNGILCLDKSYKHETSPRYFKETNRAKRTKDYTRWRVNPLSSVDFVVKVLDDDAFPPGVKSEPDSREEYKAFKHSTGAYKPLGVDVVKGAEFLNRGTKLKEHIVPVAFARKYNEASDTAKELQKITPEIYPKRTSVITPPTRTTHLLGELPNPVYDDNSIDTKVSRKPIRTTSNTYTFRDIQRTTDRDMVESPNDPITSLNFEQNIGTTKRYAFSSQYGIGSPISDENKISILNRLEVDSAHGDQNDVAGIKNNDIFYNMLDEDYNPNNKTDFVHDKKDNSGDEIAIADLIPSEISEKNDEQDQSMKSEDTDILRKSNEEMSAKQEKSLDGPIKPGNELLKIAQCSIVRMGKFNFDSTQSLDEIYTQLTAWADDSHIAKLVDITYGNLTSMDNPIFMMIIDDPSTGQLATLKRIVMIVAGIHARDHHAVSAAMYVLQQLIEKPLENRHLLEKNRFWIIPVFNPDGYEYSVGFAHRRQWTKNLHQYWDDCMKGKSCESCTLRGIRCKLKPCFGVNLDRNFEYQWIPAEELGAENPCGTLYAGERQLSEVETNAFSMFLHSQKTKIHAFITFKEGEVLGVMYPHSHTKNKRSFDHLYRERSSKAASAAYNINGRPYVAGQTSEFLPLYAGGIEDWVDGHLGIENVYTISLFRPSDATNSKLIVERIVQEGYSAMSSLVSTPPEKQNPIAPVILTRATANNKKPSRFVKYGLLCLILWNNQ